MIEKIKAFFQGRLNEAGALPAIMAGAILISATAVLLGGFSIALTRNAEINSVKTNVNYYLNRCESIMETEVLKTVPAKFASETQAKLNAKISECNVPNTINGGPIVTIYHAQPPTLYTPSSGTTPTSVKVVLGVSISKGAFKVTGYSTSVKYLDYAKNAIVTLTPDSYIESFDSNGAAVWVTPQT